MLAFPLLKQTVIVNYTSVVHYLIWMTAVCLIFSLISFHTNHLYITFHISVYSVIKLCPCCSHNWNNLLNYIVSWVSNSCFSVSSILNAVLCCISLICWHCSMSSHWVMSCCVWNECLSHVVSQLLCLMRYSVSRHHTLSFVTTCEALCYALVRQVRCSIKRKNMKMTWFYFQFLLHSPRY